MRSKKASGWLVSGLRLRVQGVGFRVEGSGGKTLNPKP